MGNAVIKRIGIRFWVNADKGCLACICKEEARVSISKPADLNCLPTECTNIRKERFDTCECKEDTTKTAPPFIFVAYEIVECIVRIECL